jgi:hypothetical protein
MTRTYLTVGFEGQLVLLRVHIRKEPYPVPRSSCQQREAPLRTRGSWAFIQPSITDCRTRVER